MLTAEDVANINNGNYTSQTMQNMGFNVSTPESLANAIAAITSTYYGNVIGTQVAYVKPSVPSTAVIQLKPWPSGGGKVSGNPGNTIATFHSAPPVSVDGWTEIDLSQLWTQVSYGTQLKSPQPSVYDPYGGIYGVPMPGQGLRFTLASPPGPTIPSWITQIAIEFSGSPNVSVGVYAGNDETWLTDWIATINSGGVVFFNYPEALTGVIQMIAGDMLTGADVAFTVTRLWYSTNSIELPSPLVVGTSTKTVDIPGDIPTVVVGPTDPMATSLWKVTRVGVLEMTAPPLLATFQGGVSEIAQPPLPSSFQSAVVEQIGLPADPVHAAMVTQVGPIINVRG